jgi:type IV secretion system protein TrbE
MLICGGVGGEPFELPMEVDGIPHMLIIGPTGTGKSTILSAMTCGFLREPGARVFIFDVGRSSYVLARCLGADYYDVGAADGEPLCPLAILDQPDGLTWLEAWFERLFARWPDEATGINKLVFTEDEFGDFMSAVRECRTPRPGRERVYTLEGLRGKMYGGVHARDRIKRILNKYVTSYGHIFNGHQEHTSDAKVVVYETSELMQMDLKFAGPAMELMLRSVSSQLDGSHRSWLIFDEFWRFLRDPVAAETLYDWLRTFRKQNCGIIATSQSLVEIANSPLCELLIESMPAKIFLPNRAASGAWVREKYLQLGVSEHETNFIAGGIPHQDFFYTSPAGARQAQLELGPVAKAIVAATGSTDVQRARQIWAEHPSAEAFTEAWLRDRVPGWQPNL